MSTKGPPLPRPKPIKRKQPTLAVKSDQITKDNRLKMVEENQSERWQYKAESAMLIIGLILASIGLIIELLGYSLKMATRAIDKAADILVNIGFKIGGLI